MHPAHCRLLAASHARSAGQPTSSSHSANARAVLLARECVAASRPSSSGVRPSEALPRRLQACMQELLTVNERYHELLHISEEQRRELESAREELGRLRPALAEAEEQLTEARAALDNAQSTCASLQAANELHAAKHEAMRAEISDLHNVLQKYAQRLLASEAELAATKQRNLEAEALLAAHWEAGYEEGKAQLETEARARLRRAQERAKQKAEEAFEHGKRVHANEVMSHRQRDEAERRVLLRRADEAKEREEKVQMVLESERQAREEAAERAHKLEERLQSVRTHKAALASELEATRAAHSADLDHFEQMENALGRACTEYSSLAVRHARLLSPPRSGRISAAGAAAISAATLDYGSSPPEAMRTRLPRPAAVYDPAGPVQAPE